MEKTKEFSIPITFAMNLLEEYDFDALPYIDKEYEHPEVQHAVNQLIANEMRTFVPRGDYIAHLPYPELKFSGSVVLQNEMARVASQIPMEKLDLSKYDVQKPEGALAKDIQAWRKAVSLAKTQHEHQTNRAMNLELADTLGSAVWLHSNSASEGIHKHMDSLVAKTKRKCEEINLSRKQEQETVLPSLVRMEAKTNETLLKAWQIKHACDNIEHTLKKHRVK